MFTENESAPKAVSLKDLNAQVGQFIRWANPDHSTSPIVKVLSQEYWENRVPRNDKWTLGFVLLDNGDTLINIDKILVDPDSALFQDAISEDEVKDILTKLLE